MEYLERWSVETDEELFVLTLLQHSMTPPLQ